MSEHKEGGLLNSFALQECMKELQTPENEQKLSDKLKDMRTQGETIADLRTQLATQAAENKVLRERVEELEAGETLVAGRIVCRTFRAMELSAQVLILEEQDKPLPNNALIALLCDCVRLTKEHCDAMTSGTCKCCAEAAEAKLAECYDALEDIVKRNEIQNWFNTDRAKAALAKKGG